MKKVFALFVILTIFLSLVAGCQFPNANSPDPNVLYDDPLSEELRQKISNAFILQCDRIIVWDHYGSDEVPSYWNPYYGIINNCVVFRQTHGVQWGIPQKTFLEIAGYTFEWKDQFDLYAYREGEACELKEAYERGWLTNVQIGKIHERHKEMYAMYLNAQEEAKDD